VLNIDEELFKISEIEEMVKQAEGRIVLSFGRPVKRFHTYPELYCKKETARSQKGTRTVLVSFCQPLLIFILA
jgi:hypothetical protein